MPITGIFRLPFAEQVAFFRQKINMPTEHYDDIIKSAHDRAFVVAGAAKADLLNDLRQAVDRSIAEGKSIGWFRKEFDAIVAKNGWTGWTGEGTKDGRDWRTRIIYRTNMSASYAAGRYAQLTSPSMLKNRPYWKYIHNDTVLHPRPLHLSWNGLVLKHDDPWWQTHFPPNGWGCRCRVTAVRADQYKGDRAPDDGMYEFVDRHGEVHRVPQGVDYGWDYAPGASVTALRANAIAKSETLGDGISNALRQQLARSEHEGERIDLQMRSMRTLQDVKAILSDIVAIKPEWLPHGVSQVVAANVDNVFAMTDSRGYFVLSTAEIPAAGGRSGLSLTLAALRKSQDGKPLDFSEEYALESIWHEMGHNRQAHQMLDSMPIEQRVIAESLRQTIARQTYPELLNMLGIEALHLLAIRTGGLSYTKSAGTFKNLLVEIGAMNPVTLALHAPILTSLQLIDQKATWNSMIQDIATVLSDAYPSKKVLIVETLHRLENRRYD
ncbi:phage minor head protein [Methylomicrobium sp. Wu6]|uniref:phage head morphogenesis protein n=1 Tax=Methylomicrobium sp. Wu6 TaxID=3107928 RepID=UPI002DD65639|nr:phage minor head protein [Methylomicrobium sp. Wu6]MEC4749995.1 phage minor head protein [Methylomicrobium sp. Wu6]